MLNKNPIIIKQIPILKSVSDVITAIGLSETECKSVPGLIPTEQATMTEPIVLMISPDFNISQVSMIISFAFDFVGPLSVA
jgi:hypothetical protein